MEYFSGVENKEMPLIAHQEREDEIEKLLLENGVPHDFISESYAQAVDEDTAVTIREMEIQKLDAHKRSDFELLTRLSEDLKAVA